MKVMKSHIITGILLIMIQGCCLTQLQQAQDYEIVSSRKDTLLNKHEKEALMFKRTVFDTLNMVAYRYQRKIGDVYIEGDYIKYQFDAITGKLIKKTTNWRDNLPLSYVTKVSKRQAESLAEGKVENSRLYIISPESDVFALDSVPDHPCWIIWSRSGDRLKITIVDAITGEVLGYGIPPPYEGFAFHCGEEDGWKKWRDNADDHFEYEMGYETKRRTCPCDDEVDNYIQSDDIALFYEISHGGSFAIHQSCSDCNSLTAIEVEAFMDQYPSMPLTFLASCGGMCDQTDGTMSFEFRKGFDTDAVVIGYCGMDNSPCRDDCWPDSRDWQDEFFELLNDGFTVGQAFARAISEFPDCNNCIRIGGDVNLIIAGDGIPKIKRSFSGSIHDYYPGISPLRPTHNRVNFRPYFIRRDLYVPQNNMLSLIVSRSRPILDLVVMNDARISSNSLIIANGENGEITIRSYSDRRRGVTIRGQMIIRDGGKIRIYE